MRGRLIRITATHFSEGKRFDTLECGHVVEVRKPTSNKDKRLIETAQYRRCPQCIGTKEVAR
jgi:hypothetical protein